MKKKARMSISSKLALGVLAVIFLLITISQVVVGTSFEKSALNDFYSSAANLLKDFSNSIDIFFNAKESAVKVFCNFDAVKNADDTIHSFINETGTIQISEYAKSPAELAIHVEGYGSLASEIKRTDNLVHQIKSAMQEQSQCSSIITDALSKMNDSKHQVQNASSDMARNSQTIISDVGTLQKETDTIKQSMSEMGTSSGRINEAGSALSEIAGVMKHSISDIGNQVGSFKV